MCSGFNEGDAVARGTARGSYFAVCLVGLLVLPLSARGIELGFRDFLIIAHRGASGHAPENTLAAFAKALAVGANAIEVDIRTSKDGHLVVIHDASVNRTTNGEGAVGDLTLGELKRLDAGSWFGDEFRDERIPTLDETVDALPDTTQIIIEIKDGPAIYPGIDEKVVALIQAKEIESRIVLKSFDADVLANLRRLAPRIRQLFVYAVRIPFLDVVVGTGVTRTDILTLPVQYLQPHSFFTTESFIVAAHEKAIRVVAWDVHDEATMKELIRMGVDGIETDYPDVLRRVVESMQAGSQ